jgi:hypothetical protein
MQIGNISIPAVRTFKPGDVRRPIEAIGGLGHRGYVPAEFVAELPTVELSGYLLQKYGSSRTVQQLKEDVEALAHRRVAYNSVSSVKGRSGWISVTRVDVDDEVGELWPLSITGQWYDSGQYKEQYSSNAVTRANDWDITGSYDQSVVEAADDVQCFDGSLEVFSTHHVFSGNCTILNGLYMVVLSENTISIYYDDGGYVKIDDFTAGTFDTFAVTELNEDTCTVKTSNNIEITLERGRVPHISSSVDLTCTSLTPADQTTDADNYLTLGTGLYVAGDESFSIADDVIDCGDLWIFRAVSGADVVAHNCLVKSNLKRSVVPR